ncbi:MAG: FkbM family methyltransferase [Salinivirgaceae bacterium]|jgi:FkbM family methyltransferase|nr:FkbM family methyltransferase [Salinivirgaceae bacterium]
MEKQMVEDKKQYRIIKIINHIFRGTLLSRIKIEPQLFRERIWIKFEKSNRQFIIKKLRHNIKIILYKESVLSRFIFLNEFEINEQKFIERYLKKDDFFIDIGANIGLFTLLASEKCGTQGKIIAFEPSPTTYKRLIENIKLNNLQNVKTFNIALSDKNGVAKLKVSKDGFDAWNSLGIPTMGQFFQEVDVMTNTLDYIANEFEIVNPILLKIDVEGWEIPILSGGEKFFKSIDAPDIMIEFADNSAKNAGYTCKDLYCVLIDYGYKIYSYNSLLNLLVEHQLQKTPYKYTNLIATKDVTRVLGRIQSI